MNFYLLAILSAVSASAIKCPAKKMCYLAGNLNSAPITVDFPECWLNVGEYWGCYDAIQGSCANINGKDGVHKSEIEKCFVDGKGKPELTDLVPAPVFPFTGTCTKEPTCYHGSQIHVPESTHFPECWLNHGSVWGCYNPVNGSCDNINGHRMVHKSNVICAADAAPIQKPEIVVPAKEQQQAQVPLATPPQKEQVAETKPEVAPKTPALPVCPDLNVEHCYLDGNVQTGKVTENFPHFWIKKDDIWACYHSADTLTGTNFINLGNAPKHCYINGVSPYECSL